MLRRTENQFIISSSGRDSECARHRTVHFVSIRDTIFSFVGRRLYFQFPASSIARVQKPRVASKYEKRTTNAVGETRDWSSEEKITFTSTAGPVRFERFLVEFSRIFLEMLLEVQSFREGNFGKVETR